MGEIQNLVRFYPLSSFPSTAFCVFGCIFHLVDVVPDTECGAHNQNISLRKFLRTTGERFKCTYLAIGFRIYTGVQST